MTSDNRRPAGPDPLDPLALAEAVAAGRLGLAAAEAALWEARPDDQDRAANEVAELAQLVAAIRGVRRHASAVRQSELEVFDPDAARVPLGSGTALDEDRRTGTRRVEGGDVRLRPMARPRPRWAPVGALAAAAVLIVAVALVGPGLLSPPVAATPSPSPSPTVSPVAIASPSASLAASPAPSASSGPTSPPPSPSATGVKGLPAIPSEALAGAPGIAYWTLTAVGQVTITEWRPDGGAPRFRFSVSTMHDPDLAKGDLVDRRIVVSPDGRRVVFAESTTAFARTRVFGTDGSLVWTDAQPTGYPDLAWSADGTRLVVGSQPATFKILTFDASGRAPTLKVRVFNGAYRVLGFSASGAVLYGWDTTGEQDWWMTPFRVAVAGGNPVSITRFSGQPDPLALSNGTTPTTNVAPADASTTMVAGVDPKTYRVLDTGGPSGRLNGWEVRDGNSATKLTGLTTDMALAWAADGSLVVADVTHPDRTATVTTVGVSAPGTPLTPTFSVAAGSYWRLFDGSRSGFAVLGLGAHRAVDTPWAGADELVAIELSTARSAVLPVDPGLTGLHPAGWISAP